MIAQSRLSTRMGRERLTFLWTGDARAESQIFIDRREAAEASGNR
jgi:hypothetical protein